MFKSFEKCEAATLAELKDEWQPQSDSTPFIVGNYVHSYFESPEAHAAFVDAHKQEIISSRGKTKGQLKSPYKCADDMIKTLNDDPFFVQNYGPGEKEVIVTGKIDGIPWKGKIDSLVKDENYFRDLKTVDDLQKKRPSDTYNERENFVFARQYHMQMVIYEELIKQTFGVDCEPFIFAVSKQTPPDHDAFHFENIDAQYRMQEAMDRILQRQHRYWRILMGEVKPIACGHCEYCRSHKRLSGFQDVTELGID